MVDYIIQNWQDTFDKTYFLFQTIQASGYNPDVIIGVARGGWVPGRLLADFFQIRETINIKVESYNSIGDEPEEAKITQDVTVGIRNKKVLVIDDIADTGESLKVILASIKEKEPAEIRTATLHFKPRSVVIPDYFVTKTEAWVIYPWEYYESIKELFEIFQSQAMDPKQAINHIKGIGIPSQMVDSYFTINS